VTKPPQEWDKAAILEWLERLMGSRSYLTVHDVFEERKAAKIPECLLDEVLCRNLYVFVPRRRKSNGEIIFILQKLDVSGLGRKGDV
jgi:hypothetical protein